MRILILGGDGYLGWPTAMALSNENYDVCVVDNYLRRSMSLENDVEPLFQVPNLIERASIWNDVSGKKIAVQIGDCCNYEFLAAIFKSFLPEAVVHYAEQPSAPFSMLNYEAAKLTLTNNLQSTMNICWAVHNFVPDCHIIKLGTMGEYGTPNIDIEEGWIDIEHKGRKDHFLFPRQASSLYHTTKIQDTDMLWFYVRTWGLRVTDLMQGPVYGLETPETVLDGRLNTIFSYDELFGTVINRFVVQAVAGYPLTVYGKGGQTRGFINIKDTLACVDLAIKNSASKGELRVYNQITETFSIQEIAEKIVKTGMERGLKVKINNITNPRVEKEEHYYNPTYSGLVDLGLEPHFLTDETIRSIFAIVEKHKANIQPHKIFRGVKW